MMTQYNVLIIKKNTKFNEKTASDDYETTDFIERHKNLERVLIKQILLRKKFIIN